MLLKDYTIKDGIHQPLLKRIEYQLEKGRFFRYVRFYFTNGEEEFDTEGHGTIDPDQPLIDQRIEIPINQARRVMITKETGNGFRQVAFEFNDGQRVGADLDWLIPSFNP